MDVLRVYLSAALVADNLVWVVRQPFRPIKALKLAVLGGLLLQCFLPEILPMTADPRVLRVAGALLVTLGLAVAARVQLGRNWSEVESATVLPEGRLVAEGIYRHIRHSIYVGDILVVGGYELALNSWLWLVVVPLTILVWKKAGLGGYAESLESSGRFLPRNVAVGVAAVAIAFTLQFANVAGNFGGNWSALFCTGSAFPAPAPLRGESIYVFADSTGYDGQFYHYIAHEPWPNEETAVHIDAARLRYPRILVPALAYVLALGNQGWIDVAFHAVSLLAFGLGAWWLGCYAQLMGAHRYLGLLFLLLPAALISLERVTIDLMLLALCCGFAYYAARGAPVGCYVVIVAATLTRDTGFLLWGAYGLWLLINRRWMRAVVFGTAALPAVVWFLIVRARTAPAIVPILPESGNALWNRLWQPVHYALPPWIGATATALDYVSLAGIVLAMALTAVTVFRRFNDPVNLAGMAFATLPLILGGAMGWNDAVAYPRTLSPMLLFLGLTAFRGGSRVCLWPVLLMLPRIAMALAPKLPGAQYLLQR